VVEERKENLRKENLRKEDLRREDQEPDGDVDN
jgi:hypothetical protein